MRRNGPSIICLVGIVLISIVRSGNAFDTTSSFRTKKIVAGGTFPSFLEGSQKLAPRARASIRSDRRRLDATALSVLKSQDDGFDDLEEQVLASARAKMDHNRVTKVLLEDDEPTRARSSLVNEEDRVPSSTWNIALSSATVLSLASYFLFFNLYVSSFVFVSVLLVASNDPVEDDSDLMGALARILGRATIKSVNASKPKVQAVARAVVSGEGEVPALRLRIEELERENAELRLWKARRMQVESSMSEYSLDELKQSARDFNLPVGGTKSDLLIRLVEAGAQPGSSRPSRNLVQRIDEDFRRDV